MAIERLRPAYTDAELKEVYSHTYDHMRWLDHQVRIEKTIEFARDFLVEMGSITDLSCGDGAIALGLRFPQTKVYLGDFVPNVKNQVTGKIEDTIGMVPSTDVFVLSETLEHVDRPEDLLHAIRLVTKQLVLTTPCDETLDNPEHYWKWGCADICSMLEQTGFQPIAYEFLEFPELDVRYQMWVAR
jgi:2-polyprenyl-3-methyl-5-hydroxy-6-metoxy-1,4-benzoquinol methylase